MTREEWIRVKAERRRSVVVGLPHEDRMTPTDFRRLALSFPEVIEGEHQGHADFRIAGKVFATLGYPSERFAVVKLSPQDQDLIVREHPRVFAPVAGKWGAGGSTVVALDELQIADEPAVRAALDAAWRRRAPKRLSAWYDGQSSDAG